MHCISSKHCAFAQPRARLGQCRLRLVRQNQRKFELRWSCTGAASHHGGINSGSAPGQTRVNYGSTESAVLLNWQLQFINDGSDHGNLLSEVVSLPQTDKSKNSCMSGWMDRKAPENRIPSHVLCNNMACRFHTRHRRWKRCVFSCCRYKGYLAGRELKPWGVQWWIFLHTSKTHRLIPAFLCQIKMWLISLGSWIFFPVQVCMNQYSSSSLLQVHGVL